MEIQHLRPFAKRILKRFTFKLWNLHTDSYILTSNAYGNVWAYSPKLLTKMNSIPYILILKKALEMCAIENFASWTFTLFLYHLIHLLHLVNISMSGAYSGIQCNIYEKHFELSSFYHLPVLLLWIFLFFLTIAESGFLCISLCFTGKSTWRF